MAALLGTLFPCLPIRSFEGRIKLPSDDRVLSEKDDPVSAVNNTDEGLHYRLRCDSTATSIVNTILNAKTAGPDLDADIASLVHQAGGWSEYLATKVLSGVEAVLKAGKERNGAMKVAYDKACEAANVFEDFVEEHPIATAVFVTVIAIGVLVIVAPYVIELLGFAELGPVEGKRSSHLKRKRRPNDCDPLQVLGLHCGRALIVDSCPGSRSSASFKVLG